LTKLTAATPSTFRIVNTTLTVPLLGLASTSVPNTASLLNIGTIAILALYGLALIGSGATMILSLIYIFKPTARIGYCALFFSFLGMNFTLTVSLNLTAVTIMVKNVVSQIEPALGVEASSGTAFLGSSWVAVICALVYNQYWIIVWLVEIRTIAFKRRTRTDAEMGNWKGVVQELKDDKLRPDRSQFYHDEAAKLQGESLRLFNETVREIDSQNIVPAFLYSGTLGLHLFVDAFSVTTSSLDEFLDHLLHSISIMRGIRTIFGAGGWAYLKTSEISDLLQIDDGDPNHKDDISDILDGLRAKIPQYPTLEQNECQVLQDAIG
jgi:hypothetical protein